MADILAAFTCRVTEARQTLTTTDPDEPHWTHDDEHDALVNLTEAAEQLLAALAEPVKDILGKLRYEECFPPPAVFDHWIPPNDSQEN